MSRRRSSATAWSIVAARRSCPRSTASKAVLEELSLADVVTAPASCRARVAALVAHVFRRTEPPSVPRSVTDLIDVVFAAQEAALVGRRRAMWGIADR